MMITKLELKNKLFFSKIIKQSFDKYLSNHKPMILYTRGGLIRGEGGGGVRLTFEID